MRVDRWTSGFFTRNAYTGIDLTHPTLKYDDVRYKTEFRFHIIYPLGLPALLLP